MLSLLTRRDRKSNRRFGRLDSLSAPRQRRRLINRISWLVSQFHLPFFRLFRLARACGSCGMAC